MSERGSSSAEGDQKVNRIVLEQREPLLRTKLLVPPMRAKRLARTSLIERINENLDKALILISAPAGFGKTTLLTEWVAQAGLPVAWLSLDAGDNDPNRFLCYVVAALNTALTEQEAPIFTTSEAMLQSVPPLPIQITLVSFLNDLLDIPEPFVLVLDDYQFITNPTIHEALTFILEHLPPHVHLILSSRVDPSLPLHRLRGRQQLAELRTDDLRFTTPETRDFLNAVMQLSLSNEQIATLEVKTEGWIVGLHMAALSMQGISDRSAFIQAFNGSHRYILEYLIEEVLNRQPEDIKAFLLRTSILDRLCSPLCDALIGNDGISQQILDYLERSNIFLIALDEVRTWYRYHHLFAEILRSFLEWSTGKEDIFALHKSASDWLDQHGFVEDAYRHAISAEAFHQAAWMIHNHFWAKMSQGELGVLQEWFACLPQDAVQSNPWLLIDKSWMLTFMGQTEGIEELLVAADNLLEDPELPETKLQQGSIDLIRAYRYERLLDPVRAFEHAKRADRILPKTNFPWRLVIPFILGRNYRARGRLNEAIEQFSEMIDTSKAQQIIWGVAVGCSDLAATLKIQGRLRTAAEVYLKTLQYVNEHRADHFGNVVKIKVGYADLLREQNRLPEALDLIEESLESLGGWGNPNDIVEAYTTQAMIELAKGDLDKAQETIEKTRPYLANFPLFLENKLKINLVWLRIWLSHKNFDEAWLWIEERQHGTQPQYQETNLVNQEVEQIAIGRLLNAKGEPAEAQSMLTGLAEQAEAGCRIGNLVQILLLQALSLRAQGAFEPALDKLKKCLAFAEPEGYMRVFLDEGRPVEELLQASSKRVMGPLKTYIDKLINAFKMPADKPADLSTYPFQPGLLIEPLTGREAEVLRLLAAGLSNQEIAEKLILSEGTIKTHTHNLYGKLGVQSRTRAIARAKELNLI